MRESFLALSLILALAIVLGVSLVMCGKNPSALQVVAIITDPASSFRAVSTGCQSVEPGEEGSCYVLFKNFSDVAVALETVNIETSDAQITQQPTGLPKKIEPGRADGVYWYFVSETIGSVVFDVKPIYSSELQQETK